MRFYTFLSPLDSLQSLVRVMHPAVLALVFLLFLERSVTSLFGPRV